MKGEREAGGIRCGEVLAILSDYLDRALDQSQAARVEAHLRECDLCERFGGEFGEMIRALRDHLGEPEKLEAAVARRLRERLERNG